MGRFNVFMPYFIAGLLSGMMLGVIGSGALGSALASVLGVMIGIIGGVVAYFVIEPLLLRGMLDRAIRLSGARGGLLLEPSLRLVTAITNEFSPVEGPLGQRFTRGDTAVVATSRLVAVKVVGSLQLRSGLGGDRVFAEVPDNQYTLSNGNGHVHLNLLSRQGDLIVRIPVIATRDKRGRLETVAEAQRSLSGENG